MSKYFKDLTDEELTREVHQMVRGQLFHMCSSISRINNLLDVEDCIQYLMDRIKFEKVKRRDMLYVWCKHKLHDLYRKEKSELKKIESFNDWYCFLSDTFQNLDNEEISCLLISINAKFKRFLDVDKYLTGKYNKINYYKIKKVYDSIILKESLPCEPNRSSIINYLSSLKNDTVIEKFTTIEYKEYENYNEFNLLDCDSNLGGIN